MTLFACLSLSQTKEVQQVCQFHITNWAPVGSCSGIKTVIDVILEVTKVQIRTGNKPIVVHCRFFTTTVAKTLYPVLHPTVTQ